jgi:hypothetical protein
VPGHAAARLANEVGGHPDRAHCIQAVHRCQEVLGMSSSPAMLSACPLPTDTRGHGGQQWVVEIGPDLAVHRRTKDPLFPWDAPSKLVTLGPHRCHILPDNNGQHRGTAVTQRRSSMALLNQHRRSSDHPGSLSHRGSRLGLDPRRGPSNVHSGPPASPLRRGLGGIQSRRPRVPSC